jgi:hypothetical protein
VPNFENHGFGQAVKRQWVLKGRGFSCAAMEEEQSRALQDAEKPHG